MVKIEEKYADLLVNYCLQLKPGEKVMITSTYLAEPLIQQVYKYALLAGAQPYTLIDIAETDVISLEYGKGNQLSRPNPFLNEAMQNFEAYLNIRAPFNLKELQNADPEKLKLSQEGKKEINKIYFQRLGDGSLKRSLCQYPTSASAQEAGMSLGEYEQFVYGACYLFEKDPVSEWLKIREYQQKIIDFLHEKDEIRYRGADFDISFSTKGRKWINSDGRNNMPSGEVFTAPVEESVNGTIRFSYPSIYMGHEVENIFLEVKDGYIQKWSASKGMELLDTVFSIDGARYFGEAAIGTNNAINRITKNILFDEKIGGSIHMAVGQSYLQAGGKNESAIHWDMITDMRNGGEIYAGGELIYRDGEFLI